MLESPGVLLPVDSALGDCVNSSCMGMWTYTLMIKDRLRNNQQPTTNHQPPTTNHHQPPTTNNQQATSNNHQPPTTNHQPPTTNHNQQPTTNNQQPATSNQQHTTNNTQPTTHNQQHTTNNTQPTTHNQQHTTNNTQPTTHNPQPTTHNPQPTTHNQQHTTTTQQPHNNHTTTTQQHTTTHGDRERGQDEFFSTLGCERCSGKAHVCYRRDDSGMGHEQAEKKDLPDIREIKRPKRVDVVQAVASQEERDEAIADFVKGIGAPSIRLSTCSLWATWMEFHEAMFCAEVPVPPLTVEKVFCVSACFKLGGYRAFKTYLSKAEDMHVLAGHQWETLLDLAFRKAAPSVLRGLGVSRQSAPFDVEVALETVNKCGVRLPPGAPVGWGNFLVLATFFMMRETEAAAALAGHLEINVVARTVSLKLPDTKADPRAVGCTRSWSFLC